MVVLVVIAVVVVVYSIISIIRFTNTNQLEKKVLSPIEMWKSTSLSLFELRLIERLDFR